MLIIDDFGLGALTAGGKQDLLDLLDDRIGATSTIVAGQLPVQEWFDYIADPAVADSRWGRFQDADESGFYEYVCREAGISVHYCAEQFENDRSLSSTIIKSMKRAMAGEYSRELSVKVFSGQCRLITLGFRQGGPAGYQIVRS